MPNNCPYQLNDPESLDVPNNKKPIQVFHLCSLEAAVRYPFYWKSTFPKPAKRFTPKIRSD